jgi:type IV pilus biogenesis/stability protein PilW
MQNGTKTISEDLIKKVQTGSEQMTEAQAIELAGEFFSRGQYKQAVNVCRQIIKHKPTHPDAHNILGVSLNAMGRSENGIAMVKRAIELAPRIASYHSNLGELYRLKGDLPAAKEELNEAVRLDPKDAQAFNNLGIIRFEEEDYEGAVECYRKAIDVRPGFPEALNNLGNALRMTKDVDGAMKAYETALSLREVYPEAYNNLGTLLREQKKTNQAEHAFKKALLQDPRYIEAYNNLALLYSGEGNDVEALRQMSEVLKFAPKSAKSLLITARIQIKRGNIEAAEQACRIVLSEDAQSAEALTMLGQVMHESDRYDDAVNLLKSAVEADPENAEARNFYGVSLKSVGRLDDAREQFLKAVELNERLYGTYANLNDLVDYSKEKGLFDRIESIYTEAQNAGSENLLPLHYAYAKALDDVGRPEEALEHYISGGKMKRAQLKYVEEDTFAFFDNIKKAFPASIFKKRPHQGNPDDRFVFIVGMPRSGSTLVEQILSSHPSLAGAGEVKFLSRAIHSVRDRYPSLSTYPEMIGEMNPGQFDLIASKYAADMEKAGGGATKITDKLLTNFYFLGLINLLFPNARIVHTKRNPVDTCFSAFTKLFKDDMPHSYDLVELGRYYRKYEELMAHWEKVLPKGVLKTIVYEDVVEDTEKMARELVDFVGLEWDDACLQFHTSSRPVKTASVAQVRKPIYKTSVERWRKYGDGLRPLLDALEYDAKA